MIERSRPRNGEDSWPRALQRDGSPDGPPDTEVYSDLFIAEGMAEFSKAASEKRYWEEAKQIVLKCVRRYDSPDYQPSIGKTYLGPNARPFPGARVLGANEAAVRADHAEEEVQRLRVVEDGVEVELTQLLVEVDTLVTAEVRAPAPDLVRDGAAAL